MSEKKKIIEDSQLNSIQNEINTKERFLKLKESNEAIRLAADVKDCKIKEAIESEERQGKANQLWAEYEALLEQSGRKSYSRMQMGYEDAMYELSVVVIAFGQALAMEEFSIIKTLTPEKMEPYYDLIVEKWTEYKASTSWNRHDKNIPKIEYQFNVSAEGADRVITRNGEPMPYDDQLCFDAALKNWFKGHDYDYDYTSKNFIHQGTRLELTQDKFEALNNIPNRSLEDYFLTKMAVRIHQAPPEPTAPSPNPQSRL